jgi:hypothetical protein
MTLFALLAFYVALVQINHTFSLKLKAGTLLTKISEWKKPILIALTTSISLTFYHERSIAAIPTPEEYNIGSGTYIKKKSVPPNASESFPNSNKVDVKEISIKNFERIMNSYDIMVQKRDWNAILTSREAKILQTPYFGYGNVKGLADTTKLTLEEAKSLELQRETASFYIGQLLDFARSNRVIYFNSVDLQMIDEISEQSGKKNEIVSISEPKEYVDQAKAAIQEMTTII